MMDGHQENDFIAMLKAEAQELLNSDEKRGGIKGVAVNRSDVFRLNPYVIVVKEGWNSRVEDDPANAAHIEALSRSIAENGVKEPLTVHWEDGAPMLTDGHCRLAATIRAIEVLGAEVRTVPAKCEDRWSSEGDRLLSQIIRNSGKPLSSFEQGILFKKLIDLGWTEKQVSIKATMSIERVKDLLQLQCLPEDIRGFLSSGKVSAALVLDTLKALGGDVAETSRALRKSIAKAEQNGLKTATRKHADPSCKKPAVREVLTKILNEALVEEDEACVTITMYPEEWSRLKEILGAERGFDKRMNTPVEASEAHSIN